MNKKQEFFAVEYVRTNSVIEAYKSAYNPPNMNRQQLSISGHRLLTDAKIKNYVEVMRAQQKIKVVELIDELTEMVRFDPITLLDDNGNMKPLDQIPATARKMVTSMDVNELWIGKGDNREQYGVVKKIKFINKLDAIEKLMKHLGGYKEDNDQRKQIKQVNIFQLPDNTRGSEVQQPRLIDISLVTPIGAVDKMITESGNVTSAGSLEGEGY